jgi:hypothetical protein
MGESPKHNNKNNEIGKKVLMDSKRYFKNTNLNDKYISEAI